MLQSHFMAFVNLLGRSADEPTIDPDNQWPLQRTSKKVTSLCVADMFSRAANETDVGFVPVLIEWQACNELSKIGDSNRHLHEITHWRI